MTVVSFDGKPEPHLQSVPSSPATANAQRARITLVSHGGLYGKQAAPAGFVILSTDHFGRLLASVLEHVSVDEAWYVRRYPDVAEAIKRGERVSAKQHYMEAGYFEDRLPRRIPVDVQWYFETYPDVKKGVKDGEFVNAQQHFDREGFREGRLPYAGWSLCE